MTARRYLVLFSDGVDMRVEAPSAKIARSKAEKARRGEWRIRPCVVAVTEIRDRDRRDWRHGEAVR